MSRHLSESQRSMIAKQLATLTVGRPSDIPSIDGISQADAAAMMNVSTKSVERAATVAKHAPDLVPQVLSGEMKVSRAATIARERVKPQTDPNQAADVREVILAALRGRARGLAERAAVLGAALVKS